MRRYTFYLAVALLAFGIGSFVVFKFYWNTQNDLPKDELTEDSKVEVVNNSLEYKKTKQPEFIEIAFKNLPCEDENLKPIWSELIDRKVSINTDYIERIKDCSDLIEVDESFDLNSDGRKEIFIRSHSGYFCGNNCQIFWVFQQDNEKRYKKLFEAKGYLPVVQNKKTQGYKDIMFEFSATYTYFSLSIYKYNGKEYVPTRCWSESKLYKNKDGELVEGKIYRVENQDCKEIWLLQ